MSRAVGHWSAAVGRSLVSSSGSVGHWSAAVDRSVTGQQQWVGRSLVSSSGSVGHWSAAVGRSSLVSSSGSGGHWSAAVGRAVREKARQPVLPEGGPAATAVGGSRRTAAGLSRYTAHGHVSASPFHRRSLSYDLQQPVLNPPLGARNVGSAHRHGEFLEVLSCVISAPTSELASVPRSPLAWP